MATAKRIVLLLLFPFVVAYAQINVPDGKTFSITLKMTTGKRTDWQWTHDEISFASGHLKSKVMMSSEHFDAPFCKWTPDSVSKTIRFETTSKNLYVSEIKWQGVVTGNKINGTAIWKNASGIQTYSFTGTLKKQE
jgi:hypothetical protein